MKESNTLTPQWKEELGENWQQIYDTYLHTFANLTLTGFNTSYSNHSFQEKKDGYTDRKGNKINGFKNSAFCLSNYLKQCSKWTIDEIKERQQILLENFLRLWPMIKTEYVPLEKEYELVSFDDDEYELSWRQIIGYRYRNERHAVSNWVEMLVQVCKLIYNESPSTMTYVAGKNYWIHASEAKGRSKVAEHCYVHTSCSTNTKRNILNYLFKECEISASILEFELVPLADKVMDSNEE
ncbi:HNH endonuclease family protein [Bacteroides stercoris]|uniref:HNH endonuclease family protein n=1 Tax=Bacteroides stercoris TaxID=46506 RepID=UPI00216B4C24|nr:HNH endonuclease family protein [Bacteroides stercoris]